MPNLSTKNGLDKVSNRHNLPHCQQVSLAPGAPLPDWLLASQQPVKLCNYVSHWPAVTLAQQSAQALCDHLLEYYTGEPLGFFFAEPDVKGRFFYNHDMSGFNFEKVAAGLDLILTKLIESADLTSPPAMFIGGTHLQHYLPNFSTLNLPVPIPASQVRNGLWVGNQSRVAIHQDLPLNIACCVAGARQFTLFPPSQTNNLYVGPLEFTPSGQPVSLVDLHHIDHQRFPAFSEALAQAQIATLTPGDALFIPSMWWHEVEATAPFNMLVNYWWRTTPAFADAPIHALQHALLSIASLPEHEKHIWQDMFAHYIFSSDSERFSHIPTAAKGMLGELDDNKARQLRSLLMQSLNR